MNAFDFACLFVGLVLVLVFYWFKDRPRYMNCFPKKEGVYRVSTVRNPTTYRMWAYFDGEVWYEASESKAEALKCRVRATQGYYWALGE